MNYEITIRVRDKSITDKRAHEIARDRRERLDARGDRIGIIAEKLLNVAGLDLEFSYTTGDARALPEDTIIDTHDNTEIMDTSED